MTRIWEEMATRLAEQAADYDDRFAELTEARNDARDRARRAEPDRDTAHTEQAGLRVTIEDLGLEQQPTGQRR